MAAYLTVFLLLNLMISRAEAEGVLFYHGDHLDSSQVTTNQEGDIIRVSHYAPFGEASSEISAVESGPIFHLYTDQELDSTTSLYNYGARCYDPILSRFMSVDPIQEETHPQDLNLYSYVWNNPLQRVDPSGMEEEEPDKLQSTNPTVPLIPAPNIDPINPASSEGLFEKLTEDEPSQTKRRSPVFGKFGYYVIGMLMALPEPYPADFVRSLDYQQYVNASRALKVCYNMCIGMPESVLVGELGEPTRKESFTVREDGRRKVAYDYYDPVLDLETSTGAYFIIDEATGCVEWVACSESEKNEGLPCPIGCPSKVHNSGDTSPYVVQTPIADQD